MGLDLCCGSVSIRVGSYSSVHRVRNYLIQSIINYLKATSENKSNNNLCDLVDISAKKELLELLDKVIVDDDINYDKLENVQMELSLINLNGFTCFINHSDCDGMIDSTDADDFIKTLNIVKDYMDKSYYHEDDEFYLKEIFEESSNTGEDIWFC